MLRRLFACEDGTAMIETVLVLPLAISLMAGGVGFGLTYLDYATAQKAIRDATRYLARVPSSYVCTWGLTNAKTMAVANTASIGWTVNDISMIPACPSPSTSTVHLQANFSYAPLFFSALGFSQTFTVTIDHEEPYVGLY